MEHRVAARVGGAALIVGAAAFVGVFFSLVAAVNNYLLPLWMIIFGWVLLRVARPTGPRGG